MDSSLAPASLGRLHTDKTDLTPREFEVFQLLAVGMTNSEIADRLLVSSPTVKTHVTSILTKLGVRNRVQAVVRAYETGVFTPGWTASR